ncbi:MAG: hypothetical protein Q7R83_00280 [bacterium]|nr:hypothetical protein [bacterium]
MSIEKSSIPVRRAPEKVRRLSDIAKSEDVQIKPLKKGVFFDVYELRKEGGRSYPWVLKDFRSGDRLKNPEQQVALFQYQYYEWTLLRQTLGDDFFPESFWSRNENFTDDQAHGYFKKPGATPNTFKEVVMTQLDRQLADRYSSDDRKKGVLKKLMSAVGRISPESNSFIGAVLQERVHGLPFGDILERLDPNHPNYPLLRTNVGNLIAGLRRYHQLSDVSAFTWHGLDSENVVAEINARGDITGRIFILDGNFTERPAGTYRESVLKKIEQTVFSKLESAFHLS